MSYARVRRTGRRPTPGASPGVSEQARGMVVAAWEEAKRCENAMFGEMYATALERKVYGNDSTLFDFMKHLTHAPVSIEEFIDGDQFIGATDLVLWPEVRQAVIGVNADWWRGMPTAKHEALLCGATGCVDRETEFLTPSGWKRMDRYEEGDLVAQYHADGRIDFVRPAYVKLPYRAFFEVKTRSFSQRLTPGHRVIYRSPETGTLEEISAEEMVSRHNSTVVGWRGQFIGTYYGGGDGLPFNDAEIRLMVAVMADGCFSGNAQRGSSPNYCVLPLKRADKIHRLRQLLREAGVPASEYSRGDGYVDIAFLAPQINKTYEGWWSASHEQLQLIAEEVLHWDVTAGRDEFYTRDKHSADFIQHVFCATGRRATVNSFTREDGRVDYVVHLVRNSTWTIASSRKQDIGLVPSEDGFCYCFTMPTGMWVSRRDGKVVVTGNTGKSEIAKLTTLYHLYLLSCLDNPQGYYGLPKATSIVFAIMAAKPRVTKTVLYDPLRHMVEHMPYFQTHLRPSKLVESEMIFEEKNIRVTPGGVDADSILGEAILGGIIDEINFMNVVLRSRKAEVTTGRAGVYDQAQTIHSAMTRRVKGRFTKPGPKIGIVCTSSSTRYKGDFTDKRKKQVVDHEETGVYIYDRAQYEVKPQENYCGEKFRLLVGNDVISDVRVLKPEEAAPEGARILFIPVEFETEFLRDPHSALRDVCGISTSSVSPFIQRRFKIYEAIAAGEEEGLESFLLNDNVILGVDGMPVVKFGHYCTDPSRPRYVHIDLSKTGDRCGIAMLRFDGLASVERSNGVIEKLPLSSIELACSIQPDGNNEIDFAEVRSWVKQLRDVYGYPIRAVTYDGIFSIESVQQWRKMGMRTGNISVDRTSVPYKHLKDAYNDNRIRMFSQDVLVGELFDLEFDDDKDKVDHPVNGSKDIADAVCGAYESLLTKRSSWVAEAGNEIIGNGRVELGERFGSSNRR